MYKHITFRVKDVNDEGLEIVTTVITQGYAYNGSINIEDDDPIYDISFMVHRNDLADLRRDVEVLVRGGFNVREVELN